jgi:mRNA interferase RelE/StbE
VGKYRVFIKPSAAKELEAIAQKKDRQRIVRRIESLGDDPRPPGSQKLTGHTGYRVRQGRYRIVYEIEDDMLIVLVIKIADRKDVYRES